MSSNPLIKFFLFFIFCSVTGVASALDVVNFSQGMALYDSRASQKQELITEILEATKKEFGPYELNLIYPPMTFQRAISELRQGHLINCFMSVARDDWDEEVAVIEVPIMRGLMSYRLLMVHEKNKEKFAKIQSIDELKEWRAGSLKHWSLTKVLEQNDFKVVKAESYETLFKMLSTGRFDYLLRGVNEVFSEADNKELVPENVEILPKVAVFIPLPQYLFVSEQSPRLAKRLRTGMNILIGNGRFQEINMKYHKENITRADLAHKKILMIPNPDVSAEVLGNKQFWIHFDSKDKEM